MREVGLDEVLAGLPAGLPLPVGCWLIARVAISMGSNPRLIAPETVRISGEGAVRLDDGPRKIPFHLRSPEAIRGGDTDDASSVFNLAGLLVHTLTGRAPFLRGSDMECRIAVTEEAVPKLVGRVAQASPALDELAAKALRKDPGMRFETPVQFGEALHGYLEAELHEADAADLGEIVKTAIARQAPADEPKSDAKAIGSIGTKKKVVRRENPLRGIQEVDSGRRDERAGSVRPPPDEKPAPKKKKPAPQKKKPKGRGELRADRRIGGLRKPVSAPPERMAPLAEEEDEALPQPISLAPPPPDDAPVTETAPQDDPFGAMPPSLETPLEEFADELELPMGDEEDSLELDALALPEPEPERRPTSRPAPAGSLLEIDETALREESSYVPPPKQPVRRPPRPVDDDDDDYVDDDVGTAWLKPVGAVLFGLLALAIVYQFLIRPLLASFSEGS